MKKIFLIATIALFVFSCSKDDDEKTTNKILTGTVEGKAFTFKGGKALYRDSNDTENITLYLTNEVADCSDSVLDLRIIADVPSSVGSYNEINIVTVDGLGTPFNNIGESVEITAVTETSISGKMTLNHSQSSVSEESIFEGTFTLPICVE